LADLPILEFFVEQIFILFALSQTIQVFSFKKKILSPFELTAKIGF